MSDFLDTCMKYVAMPFLFLMIVGSMVFIIYAVAAGIPGSEARHERLMQECMADGHKEYECVGLLKGRDADPIVVPAPVIIR